VQLDLQPGLAEHPLAGGDVRRQVHADGALIRLGELG
jgi:hypothetical protein